MAFQRISPLDMNLTQVAMDDDSYLGLYCLEAWIVNNLDLNDVFIKVCYKWVRYEESILME
jgi:hypothetical protein